MNEGLFVFMYLEEKINLGYNSNQKLNCIYRVTILLINFSISTTTRS